MCVCAREHATKYLLTYIFFKSSFQVPFSRLYEHGRFYQMPAGSHWCTMSTVRSSVNVL